MNIFEFSNIQEILESYIAEQKVLGQKLTYQDLAKEIRVQKSYLSKVMKKDASLNKDQTYLLCKKLKLNESERDFVFLLIDRDKVAIPELKKELSKKIKTLQNLNTKSENYIETETNDLSVSQIQQYYLNAENQLIHLSLGIEKFQQNVDLLKDVFNLSNDQLNKSLNLLNQLKLIEIKDKKIIILKSNLHIPKDSPFFESWQTMVKLKSQEHIKKVSPDNKYNFIATFSADEKSHEEIRIEFMKYLKKVETIVKRAPRKDLYQIHYDLFKWS